MTLIDHVLDQLPAGISERWQPAARDRLIGELRGQSLPSRRDENWKYTSLAGLDRRRFSLAANPTPAVTAEDLSQWVIPELPCHRLVFVNGRYAPALSFLDGLPDGVTVQALSDVNDSGPFETQLEAVFDNGPDDRLARLNAVALHDALLLDVAAGVLVEQPLHCLFIGVTEDEDTMVNLRQVLRLGEGASLTLIEQYLGYGEAASLTNVVLQTDLAANAMLEHLRLQQDSVDGHLITRTDASQAAHSTYRYHGFDLGGGLVRHDLNCRLQGEGASCSLAGAYALADNQHVDNHSRIDHIAPNAQSSEFFKGVLDGRSKAVFNGKVVVHQGADGTDARQANNNLLLSKLAEVDTKPELEIYADDVKCAHGATVGQLDADQLYYLRSRGIAEADARRMLTYAFCREIVDQLENEALREFVGSAVNEQLPQAATLQSNPVAAKPAA